MAATEPSQPGTIERILVLASAFPSLREHPAVIDWDPWALDRWAQTASHGERLAVQFVLRVWNQFQDWGCGRFDVVEAIGTWDADHRAAFQAWAANPFVL